MKLPFWVDTVGRSGLMEIRVDLGFRVLRFVTRRKLAYEANVHIFILWMLGASIVLVAVAILFLRNQIRPILRLAEAAEDFGKGRDVDFHPRGAREVRQAGYAFIEMKRRIERATEQRTAMLNGVSHDLRTILTRFKLSLAVIDESAEIEPLQNDVDEMQRMLEAYLAFARGDAGEPTSLTDLRAMLEELRSEAERHGAPVGVETKGDLTVKVRPLAIKRCLGNLVANAQRHADTIVVRALREQRFVIVHVDDDGPGIPPEHARGRVPAVLPARRGAQSGRGRLRARPGDRPRHRALAWRRHRAFGKPAGRRSGPVCGYRLEPESDRGGDPARQLALGARARLGGDALAVLEHHQRRDRADAELGGDLRVLVDVELGDLHLALHLGGDLFERRRDHAAGPAPFRPEIDYDRLARLDDVGLEAGVGDFAM